MESKDKFITLCESVRYVDDESLVGTSIPNRRQLLADRVARIRSEGLRITPTLTPKLYHMLTTVTNRIGLREEPEAYVAADPVINAFALVFGVRDRPVIMLTSGLVDLLEPAELQFVIGHELGHLGLNHMITDQEAACNSEFEALKHRALSRCAEISADRIGLISIGSLITASNVMIKLASGLNSRHVVLDVRSFLDQLQHHPEEANREWELEQLHPSLPLRLWALIQFSKTSIYLKHAGTGEKGISLKEVDREISARLSELGNGRLTQMEQRRFDIAATWVGAALVFEDGIIEKHEEAHLRELIGDELANKALKFARDQGIDAVLEKLDVSLRELNTCGKTAQSRILETHRAFAENLNMNPMNCRAGRILYSVTQL